LLANQAMASPTTFGHNSIPRTYSLSHRTSGGMDILASTMSSLTISITKVNVFHTSLRFGQTNGDALEKSREEQSVFITELFGSQANTTSTTSGEMRNIQQFLKLSEEDSESLESLTGWSPVLSRESSVKRNKKIINELD